MSQNQRNWQIDSFLSPLTVHKITYLYVCNKYTLAWIADKIKIKQKLVQWKIARIEWQSEENSNEQEAITWTLTAKRKFSSAEVNWRLQCGLINTISATKFGDCAY